MIPIDFRSDSKTWNWKSCPEFAYSRYRKRYWWPSLHQPGPRKLPEQWPRCSSRWASTWRRTGCWPRHAPSGKCCAPVPDPNSKQKKIRKESWPSANFTKQYKKYYLSTSQAHSTFAHAVRAGQVQLEGISPGICCQLRQLRPVGLVIAAHDAGNQNL